MSLELQPDDIIGVIGKRGTGKSNLSKHLAIEYLEAGHKMTIYDTAAEHRDLRVQYPEQVRRIVPKPASLEDFETVAAQVYREGNQILFVEELELICSSSRIGPNHAKLIHLGRHRKVGMIFTARRIADCHKLPPSQAHHLMLFRTHLPNDIRYLRAILGDVVDELPKIEDYHFLHWHNEQVTMMEPVPLEVKRT